jgi:hypothetical protein
MKPIEEAVTNIQGEVVTVGNKWRVTTPFGRVIKFDDQWLALEQCRTPLLPGETKCNREETQFEACMFMQEAYGCVDVRKLKYKARTSLGGYARLYGFTVDDNKFRPFGISEAKAVFGDEATVRNNSFPAGWRITVPDAGHVVIGLSGKDLNLIRIEGNLYAEALRFFKKKQGHAVVRGKSQFCATVLAHGEVLGIKVIPEIPVGLFGWYLRAHVAWLPAIPLGFLVFSLFPNLGLWWIFGGGGVLATVLMNFIMGDDRKRGDVLVNKFPQLGGRDAKLDEARQRGVV